jgi:hypothetical protein
MFKGWWLYKARNLHEAGSEPKIGPDRTLEKHMHPWFGACSLALMWNFCWYKYIMGQGWRPSSVEELLWRNPKKPIRFKADLVELSKEGYGSKRGYFAYDHNHKYIFPFSRQILKVTWNVQRIVKPEGGNEIRAGTLLKFSERRMFKICYCEAVHLTWSNNCFFLQCIDILLALMLINLWYKCSPPAEDTRFQFFELDRRKPWALQLESELACLTCIRLQWLSILLLSSLVLNYGSAVSYSSFPIHRTQP